MHKVFINTNIDSSLYFEKNYKKNEILFNDSDFCDKVGFVESGLVSIVTNTYKDNEYEIKSISSNGSFGSFIIFSNKPYYLGTGIAKTNTKVIYFRKDNLLKALKDSIFLQNFLSLITEDTLKTQYKIKVLSQSSIKEKILFILNENKIHNNTNIYRIKSKEQFAKLINCPRPSLSRALIELKNENILDYDRYKIILK